MTELTAADVLADLFESGEWTPPSQWQPIDTAPKDGTRIDLLFRGPVRFTDCVWSEGAWWTIENDEPSVGISHGLAQPTHWMPMPAPPPGTEASHAAELVLQRLTDAGFEVRAAWPKNIPRLLDTIENAYHFECEAGPLKNCGEWKALKRALGGSHE